jgi:dihydrolipoamide dehydrogenase
MTPERFDTVVLGAGPGGEVVADRLLKAGQRVAVVERELIGGECAYWACIPSKTLLRPPDVASQADRVPGAGRVALEFASAARYRDYMVRDLDDAHQVEGYRERGAEVVKAAGRLAGPGRVEAGDRVLEADNIVVATGSDTKRPPIDGLDEVDAWTNREATTLKQLPASALIVGGGPVGVELAQMLARFGCRVTVVQSRGRPLDREDPRPGELVAEAMRADGIDLRLDGHVERVAPGVVASLDDGSEVRAERLILAAGRSPRTTGLGAETLGIALRNDGALEIDDRCRAGADGLWAVGDVTGAMPFTHVAKYHGRIVAANILGGDRRADLRGVPRVVFSDPELAAVGLTESQAHEQGIDLAVSRVELPKVVARPWTYEREPRGELAVLADRRRRVLVGAWAVAPLAGEWIHLAALAIRTELAVDVLLDTVAQFPTFTEGYLSALEGLDL